jgi:hypothetical protein
MTTAWPGSAKAMHHIWSNAAFPTPFAKWFRQDPSHAFVK